MKCNFCRLKCDLQTDTSKKSFWHIMPCKRVCGHMSVIKKFDDKIRRVEEIEGLYNGIDNKSEAIAKKFNYHLHKASELTNAYMLILLKAANERGREALDEENAKKGVAK